MIAIIDYGVGNLYSLSRSLDSLNLENKVTRDEAELRSADKIILPGVGAFGDAMAKLEGTGLVPVVRERRARACRFSASASGCNYSSKRATSTASTTGWGF